MVICNLPAQNHRQQFWLISLKCLDIVLKCVIKIQKLQLLQEQLMRLQPFQTHWILVNTTI